MRQAISFHLLCGEFAFFFFLASIIQHLTAVFSSERVYLLLLVRVREQPAQITCVTSHLFPQCTSQAYLTIGISLVLILPLFSPSKFGCFLLSLVKTIYFLNAESLS